MIDFYEAEYLVGWQLQHVLRRELVACLVAEPTAILAIEAAQLDSHLAHVASGEPRN